MKNSKNIHSTADVSNSVFVGRNTYVWHQSQIREKAKIGNNCVLGKGVYVDKEVIIGNNVKIQNYASLYFRSVIEDGVFIGPYVCLTNDKHPRAITPDGSLKSDDKWTPGSIVVKKGASIGAGAVVLTNIVIGEYAMVGAGSVVTKDVGDHVVVVGVPAKFKGFVCKCGKIISRKKKPKEFDCKNCS